MTTLETRYPCPVCLGVKMEKVRLVTASAPDAASSKRTKRAKGASVARAGELVLDHCTRCGGVWFDAGEVRGMRDCDSTALWSAIVRRDGVHSMLCHGCKAPLARTETKCHACGWTMSLDCPICSRPMRIEQQDGLRLDYCPHDRGVWFDHDELTGIWKLNAHAVAKRRNMDVGVGDVLLLDVLTDPFLLYFGVHAAANVAGAAAHAVTSSGAAEALGSAAEAVGEVAGSIFETVAEIIGGIFG